MKYIFNIVNVNQSAENLLVYAFLEGVHERFRKEENQRLSILQELGQRLELRDGVLTFELADPYLSLKWARDAVESAVGRLEPLDCGLDKVQKGNFDIAISVWSGIRESNPRLKLGKLAYYHCTNPAEASESVPEKETSF
jgi:hypothetical protein